MSVEIIRDKTSGYSCLMCNTTMIVFGSAFYGDEEPQDFIDWLGHDPRELTTNEVSAKISEWRTLNSG